MIIKLTTVQLSIDPDNRLHIKQKEPFQALFSENFSFGDPSAVLVQLFEEIHRFIMDGFYEWKESLEGINN
jgi:hypothetical protein